MNTLRKTRHIKTKKKNSNISKEGGGVCLLLLMYINTTGMMNLKKK
jgi:hypothetical protein